MEIDKKIIEEIKSEKHETVEAAIDASIEIYPLKTEDYYFMAFDINNDPDGDTFSDLVKVKISHNNELELMGKIGSQVNKMQKDDLYVMFLNKRRAMRLLEKVRQWEE